MCHTTYYHLPHHLKINSITLQLSLSSTSTPFGLPDFLTLVFLPRINATRLDINGTKLKPDTPGFITLHRILHNSHIVFASKDRVLVSDGTAFEVHVADYKLVKGVFRQEFDSGAWKMDCKSCMLMESGFVGVHVREVEASVGYESDTYTKTSVVMREKVELKSKKCRRRFEVGLEDIPEERDWEVEEGGMGGGCGCFGDESDCEEEFECVEMDEIEREMEEGVRWAVDVGIWAACLGVGLVVSGVSARRLFRNKLSV